MKMKNNAVSDIISIALLTERTISVKMERLDGDFLIIFDLENACRVDFRHPLERLEKN